MTDQVVPQLLGGPYQHRVFDGVCAVCGARGKRLLTHGCPWTPPEEVQTLPPPDPTPWRTYALKKEEETHE